MITALPNKIETKRLILRPYRWKDLDALADLLHDANTTRYLPFPGVKKSFAGVSVSLKQVIDSYNTDTPIFSLAVIEKATALFLGTCGLHLLADGSGYEVYYIITPQKQGQGFATEALRGLMTYAVDNLAAKKLAAYISRENHPSRRVAEKVGFQTVLLQERPGYDMQFMVWKAPDQLRK